MIDHLKIRALLHRQINEFRWEEIAAKEDSVSFRCDCLLAGEIRLMAKVCSLLDLVSSVHPDAGHLLVYFRVNSTPKEIRYEETI